MIIDDNEEDDSSKDPSGKLPEDSQGIPGDSTDQEKDEKEKQDEQERLEMLFKADEVKGEQLAIDVSGNLFTEEELRNAVLAGVHDPDKMYETYYKGIDKLLRQNLPKSDKYKAAREAIYEEKNCFLTRGHRKNDKGIRGADGRMGYTEDAEIILETVIRWVVSRGTPYNLFTDFRDLNNARGYPLPS